MQEGEGRVCVTKNRFKKANPLQFHKWPRFEIGLLHATEMGDGGWLPYED